MKRPHNFLEELAGAFHAGIGLGNLFIAYYNWRRGSKGRAILHVAIGMFEGRCFHEHWRANADDTKVVDTME